jgi:hypothetical protein
MIGGTGSYWSDARRNAQPWDEPRRAKLKLMWDRGDRVDDIADALKTSRGAIYVQASKLGLARRKARKEPSPNSPSRVAAGRRRFAGIEPKGFSRVVLPPHHPASREGACIFPSTVIPAGQVKRLLKSGEHSRKIGGTVAKGALRGRPIFTLTLEERETCPRSCEQWASCYGNNMHMAQRIADDGTLIRRLWAEMAVLNVDHPSGFLIRLHVLGDFYSEEYVALWRQALNDFPGLRIFGFTARMPPDPIGVAVAELARDFYDRFRIRFSGLRYEDDGAIVVDRREDAIGILCPAEADPDRCCATCALCWQSNRTISFLRH